MPSTSGVKYKIKKSTQPSNLDKISKKDETSNTKSSNVKTIKRKRNRINKKLQQPIQGWSGPKFESGGRFWPPFIGPFGPPFIGPFGQIWATPFWGDGKKKKGEKRRGN